MNRSIKPCFPLGSKGHKRYKTTWESFFIRYNQVSQVQSSTKVTTYWNLDLNADKDLKHINGQVQKGT